MFREDAYPQDPKLIKIIKKFNKVWFNHLLKIKINCNLMKVSKNHRLIWNSREK